MPSTCVQSVNNQCMRGSKTCESQCTAAIRWGDTRNTGWSKTLRFTRFTTLSSTAFSTDDLLKSPLAEHYFYPFSTGPITTFTNLIY